MRVYVSILFLALIGQTIAAKVTYRDYKVYKIIPKDLDAVRALKDLEDQTTDFSPFQFWQGPTGVGRPVNLMVSPQFQNVIESTLADLNAESTVTIEDVQAKIDAENRWARVDEPNPFDWTVYNTLEEFNTWLDKINVEFPNETTILKPGQSHLGRDIVGLKLDFSPTVNKPVVFMESNIHAREWITSAVSTYILNEFLRNETESVRGLAEKYTWYFFPVMNPDGFAYSHETERLWRKTRTRYNMFCYGADPNRNWDFEWMSGGASQNPCSDIYAGPYPFSEPSVAVMSAFIANITDNMVAYLDFHSYSQMLLLPFGHTTDHLLNFDEMMKIAETAMTRLESVHGTKYVWGTIAETIYIAAGSSMDWVKGVYEVPIAYTYELRDEGEHGFILPADQIIPTCEETLESIISIFEEYELLYPGHATESRR